MKRTCLLSTLAAALLAGTAVSSASTVLLEDTWASGSRTEQNLPTSSAWYGTSAARLIASPGMLTGNLDGSSRMWMTYFTDSGPAQLAEEGDRLVIELDFTVADIAPENTSRGFRVGLFNYGSTARIAEDGFSSSDNGAVGVVGYALSTNFGATVGTDNPLQIRRRMGDTGTFTTNGNLMGSIPGSGLYSDTLGQGGGNQGDAMFLVARSYTLSIIAERTASGVSVTYRFADDLGWSIETTANDNATPVYGFDTIAIRPGSAAQAADIFRFTRMSAVLTTQGDPVDPIDPVDPVDPTDPDLQTVLLDTWASGSRTVQDLPNSSAWFGTSADRLIASEGMLTGNLDGSSRMWMTYFTDSGALELAEEGDSVVIELDFTVQDIAPENTSRGFRVGLFSYGSTARIAEDGFSSSDNGAVGVVGYALSTNFGTTVGTNNPLQIRRRMGDTGTFTTNGNLMGSVPGSGLYSDTLGQGGGSQGDAMFSADRSYTLSIIAERTASGVSVTYRFADDLGWSIEAIANDDATPIYGFDTIAIRPGSAAQAADIFRFTRMYVATSSGADPVDPVDPVDPIDPVDPVEPAFPFARGSGAAVAEDVFARTDRLLQAPPGATAWYSTSTDRLTITQDGLLGVLDGSSRMWITHFTDANAVPLAEGEGMRVEMDFSAESINASTTSRGLRVGLFDYSNGTRVFEDGFSSSGAGMNVVGYLLNTNFAQTVGVNNPMQIRRRMGDDPSVVSNLDNLMGSVPGNGIFSDTLASGGGTEGNPLFSNSTPYTLEITVLRKGDALEVTFRFYDENNWVIEAFYTDTTTAHFAFDTIAIRPDGAAAASFTISRFSVEYFGDDTSWEPSEPVPADSIFASIEGYEGSAYRHTFLGWIWDEVYPWVYTFSRNGWIYVFPSGASLEGFVAYEAATGDFLWASELTAPWVYDFDAAAWFVWP